MTNVKIMTSPVWLAENIKKLFPVKIPASRKHTLWSPCEENSSLAALGHISSRICFKSPTENFWIVRSVVSSWIAEIKFPNEKIYSAPFSRSDQIKLVLLDNILLLRVYIHTYIIGLNNPSVRNIDLLLGLAHGHPVLFFHKLLGHLSWSSSESSYLLIADCISLQYGWPTFIFCIWFASVRVSCCWFALPWI